MTLKSEDKNLEILYHRKCLYLIYNRIDTIYLPEMIPTLAMCRYMLYREVLWTSLAPSAQPSYEDQSHSQEDHHSPHPLHQTDRDTPGINTSLFHR
jgi:hypothetical protein